MRICLTDFAETGELIEFHRKKAGLTQIELAELAGVGKSAVYDVEHGKATMRLNTVLKILNTLNISLRLEGPLVEEFAKSRSGPAAE